MTKLGTSYEKLVQDIFQTILNTEYGQRNIKVQRNVKLIGKSGIEREFDIYWEYEQAGFIHKTVIECKDYSNPISIDRIDAFIGKLQDFPNMFGVFATKVGYQSGAKTYAENNNIDTIIIREPDITKDFVDQSGIPLIKVIQLNIEMHLPPTITKVNAVLDKEYIKENSITNIPPNEYVSFPDKIWIEDTETGAKNTLYDIIHEIEINPELTYGHHEKQIRFSNTFITYENGTRFKIKQLDIAYEMRPPVISTINIDAQNIFTAIIEYLSNGNKKALLYNGTIKNLT